MLTKRFANLTIPAKGSMTVYHVQTRLSACTGTDHTEPVWLWNPNHPASSYISTLESSCLQMRLYKYKVLENGKKT